MNETKTWLRRPRYSPLDLAFFLVIIAGTTILGGYWSMRRDHDMVRAAIMVSPLPKVVVAPSAGTHENVYRKQYEFSADWFTMHLPAWKKVLEPFQGKPGLNYLEVGSYEGRSMIWMMENVLTDPTARATAVDLFDGPFKDKFAANIERCGAGAKVTSIAGYSQVVLRTLPLDAFDIIYIDGSHAKSDVLEDTVLSWRLLKVGGLMIFDDYLNAERSRYVEGEFECPKMAIDPFVQCFEGRCEVLHNEYQLVIRKKA
jgi:hypothetical protein